MKPGDVVYLKLKGQWFEYTVQRLHDFEQTMTLQNGVGEFICRQSEPITRAAYVEMLRAEHEAERRIELADVISFWEKGLRAADQMQAAANSGTARGWGQRIRSAKNWGFIKEEKPNEPSTADKSDGPQA